uniref:Uncharacterized protein n=1 Tax=Panagrolaimus sp. ES5 TaxID=591445 RepID=A0AC34GUZ2_9BILA
MLTFNGGKTVPESGKHYVAIYYIKVGDMIKKTAHQFWQDHKSEPTGTKRLYVDLKKLDQDQTVFEPVKAVSSPAIAPMTNNAEFERQRQYLRNNGEPGGNVTLQTVNHVPQNFNLQNASVVQTNQNTDTATTTTNKTVD